MAVPNIPVKNNECESQKENKNTDTRAERLIRA